MARWKLACPHYINVPGVEWEYNENKNGKMNRKRFSVPRFLNTADPADWTNKWGSNKDDEDGEIIVCLEGKGEGRDIAFIGDPTPDMIPVDDEARALSKSFETRWAYKPETAEMDFSQSLVNRFETMIGEVSSKPQEVPGMSDLVSALSALTQLMTAKEVASSGLKLKG